MSLKDGGNEVHVHRVHDDYKECSEMHIQDAGGASNVMEFEFCKILHLSGARSAYSDIQEVCQIKCF